MAQTIPSIKVLQPNQGESLWALGEKLTSGYGRTFSCSRWGFRILVWFARRASGAGGFVFVPRGTLHSFRSIDRDVARLFDVHSPGGFEAFFEEAGTPAKNPTRRPPGIAGHRLVADAIS